MDKNDRLYYLAKVVVTLCLPMHTIFLQFRCILCYIQTSWNWKRGCTYLKSHNTLKFEPESLKCILSVPKISYDTNLIIVTCYLAIKNSTQTYSNKIWYLPQCAYLDMTSIQKN